MPVSMRTPVSTATLRAVLLAVVAGAAVALLTLGIDALVDVGPQIASGNARALLGANVGGLVTIGAFSFWMRPLMAQLASTVVPPNLVANHVHDRFQRRIIAMTVGALVYEVLVLLAIPGSSQQGAPIVSTVVGTLVGGGAVVGLLVAMQHGERTMRPARLLAEASHEVIHRLRGWSAPAGEADTGIQLEDVPEPSGRHVRGLASATGWVTEVDQVGLVGAVPDGSLVRTEVAIGSFVTRGWTPVVTVWSPDEGLDPDELARRVSVGQEPGADLDVSAALRVLIDVGVHAASDGAGAPSMVYDVLDHLGAVMHEMMGHQLIPEATEHDGGRILVRGAALDRSELLDQSLTRLRRSLADEPATAIELLRTVHDARCAAIEHGRTESVAVLDRQLDLVVEQCRHAGPLAADLDQVVRARQLGRGDVPPGVDRLPGGGSDVG